MRPSSYQSPLSKAIQPHNLHADSVVPPSLLVKRCDLTHNHIRIRMAAVVNLFLLGGIMAIYQEPLSLTTMISRFGLLITVEIAHCRGWLKNVLPELALLELTRLSGQTTGELRLTIIAEIEQRQKTREFPSQYPSPPILPESTVVNLERTARVQELAYTIKLYV